MFKRKSKHSINPDSTDTLLGEGTVFEGNLESEASIRIEGQMTGDVKCKGDVTIGDGGNATSNISARNVLIAGMVRGNITTTEKLTITSTGQLHGNVVSKQLIIDEGGVFIGNSQMNADTPQSVQTPQNIVPQQSPLQHNYKDSDSAANM